MGGEVVEAGGARIMGASHAMALFRNASWLKLHFKSCFQEEPQVILRVAGKKER